MGSFRVIEEIALADCALEIHGRDLDDLFETAARALAEQMADTRTVTTTLRHTITLSAPGCDALLYDWLSELILRKDRDREVFTVTRVRIEGQAPCRLEAEVEGGVLDERVARRSDPKAVTLHDFLLERDAGGWHARLVIDI